MVRNLQIAVEQIADWPVAHAASAAVSPETGAVTCGDVDMVFELASVTKALFAYCCLVAIEEGTLDLDHRVSDAITVRHLLSHSSGLDPAFPTPGFDRKEPEVARIYSNVGFDLLADTLHRSSGLPPAQYFADAITEPLGLANTAIVDSVAYSGRSTVSDLTTFAQELLSPTLISQETLTLATTTCFADLAGTLPGFGRFDPNPWGLGFEIKGNKSPHWMSKLNSPASFGHFGQSGTFLWVDPQIQVALVSLTDEPFGAWAKKAWPALSTSVVDALR